MLYGLFLPRLEVTHLCKLCECPKEAGNRIYMVGYVIAWNNMMHAWSVDSAL